jgi:hypothetical protein
MRTSTAGIDGRRWVVEWRAELLADIPPTLCSREDAGTCVEFRARSVTDREEVATRSGRLKCVGRQRAMVATQAAAVSSGADQVHQARTLRMLHQYA